MDLRVSFPGGMRVDAEQRGVVIPTDQPVHAGGGGSAPAPFDYFIASIGTCAGFYVLNFLKKRNLPVEGVHLALGTVEDTARHRVAEITIRVVLPATFPDKYRAALVRAVDLCSVKKHVLEPPVFRTIVEIGGRAAA